MKRKFPSYKIYEIFSTLETNIYSIYMTEKSFFLKRSCIRKKTDEMRRVKWVLGKYFYNENLIITTKLRIAGSDFFFVVRPSVSSLRIRHY